MFLEVLKEWPVEQREPHLPCPGFPVQCASLFPGISNCLVQRIAVAFRGQQGPEEESRVIVGTQELPDMLAASEVQSVWTDIWMQVTPVWGYFKSCPHCSLGQHACSVT